MIYRFIIRKCTLSYILTRAFRPDLRLEAPLLRVGGGAGFPRACAYLTQGHETVEQALQSVLLFLLRFECPVSALSYWFISASNPSNRSSDRGMYQQS
jgi:hypothetical protein